MRRGRTVATILAWLLCAAPAVSDGITLEGTSILRDGEPFQVHGVQLMSFAAPIEYLENPPAESCGNRPPPCPFRAYVNAHEVFGPELLRDAAAFGANTILFKVSAPGLDRQHPTYSKSYAEEIRAGVELARSQGFVVIVSIQQTRVSGTPGPMGTRSPIPDLTTLRAGVEVAKLFGDDRGVMIELYVEPYAQGRRSRFWDYYIDGGGGYPGLNRMIGGCARPVRRTC